MTLNASAPIYFDRAPCEHIHILGIPSKRAGRHLGYRCDGELVQYRGLRSEGVGRPAGSAQLPAHAIVLPYRSGRGIQSLRRLFCRRFPNVGAKLMLRYAGQFLDLLRPLDRDLFPLVDRLGGNLERAGEVRRLPARDALKEMFEGMRRVFHQAPLKPRFNCPVKAGFIEIKARLV